MGNKTYHPRIPMLGDDGPFRVLPVEAVVTIASQLEASDVITFSRVSHGLQNYISQSHSLWNYLLQRDFRRNDDLSPEAMRQIRMKNAIMMVADGVARALVFLDPHRNYAEMLGLIEEMSDTFDVSFFETLNQNINDNILQDDAPPSLILREEATRLLKKSLKCWSFDHQIDLAIEQAAIVPVTGMWRNSLTVLGRNTTKDVQRPLDVYKRFTILFRCNQRIKTVAGEKGHLAVDSSFVVYNMSDFSKPEKCFLRPATFTSQYVIRGPNVIAIALTGPPQAGISTLVHSLSVNRDRGAAYQPGRTGTFGFANDGFYYEGYQFLLVGLTPDPLKQYSLDGLPERGGTIAAVLDGTKPVDESLAFLAEVIERVKRRANQIYMRETSHIRISFIVLVNKADIASVSLLPFAELVKTHLKKLVNYGVFYTSPFLPLSLDIVWDWMIARAPKFNSSYLSPKRSQGCTLS